MFKRVFLVCYLGFCLAVSAALAASDLPEPEGQVLLRVTGAVERSNMPDAAVFDRDMLENLDWVEVETFTSFTTGAQRFAGPTLSSVLEAVGAHGATIRATAINDYTVVIPAEHAARHNVILALDNNGRPMRVRDKGPIWVVYPLSQDEAEMKPFDGEMIWQLVELRIE